MTSEDDSVHDLNPFDQAAKARQVADKTLERLRMLNEQYPSPELEEAIRKLEAWRQKQHLDE